LPETKNSAAIPNLISIPDPLFLERSALPGRQAETLEPLAG
jgi:hypothetical protein